MTNPITIRPPQKKDLHSLLNFINDLVAEDIFINVNQKQTLVQEKKYINNTLAKIKKNQQVVLLALHNKLLIGNCGITRDRYRSSSVGTLDISIKKEYRDFIRKRIRTTNVIERVFREIRRRTKPMSCFNNNDSLQRIMFAVFYRLNTNWKTKPLTAFTQFI